jgi:hypothetical protein
MSMVQWVNPERTVLVRWWPEDDGGVPAELEVATRPETGATWGPPITVEIENGNRRSA